jgi:peptidyl-prolyl cis-trans isomerase D
MFDLFRSRAKVVRYLLGAVLLTVALSMVVTLIPGFVGASYAPDNVIAEIGDEVLSTRDVQLSIQQQLRNNTIPREMVGVYVPMIVNQMISDRAVAFQAARMGVRVTDADVALAVESMLPQLFQNGQFVGQDVYAQYLSQMNLTIPEFESNVRKQILLLRLTNLVLEGEVVSEKEIEEDYRRANEKIKIEYISISPADFRARVEVSRQEMADYFEKNKASFQIGEKRDARILVADQGELAKTVAISDERLQQVYRTSADRFRVPDRVKVRHILLKTTGKSPQESEKIKQQAEALLKQIRGGADFAELAKKNSEDTGTAGQGGELGWISRGQTVQNFENTAFTLKPGELSGVISTEYGFHIIQVQEKDQARTRPFEEVKGEIAEELRRQSVYDRVQSLADQARAELLKSPLEAEAIASRLGLTLVRVERAGAADPIPEISASADMLEAVRTMAKGGVSSVLELGPDRLGVAVVTEIYPVRPAEFGEVEAQIRDTLVTQKSQAMAAERRKRLEELVKTSGNDLQRIARELGATVKSSPEFSRDGNVDGVGAAAYLQSAFEQPAGAIIGPLDAGGPTVVCRVVEKIPADLTKLAAERSSIAARLKRQKAAVRRELFEDGVLTRLIAEGKIRIYEKNVQRLVGSYRG